MSQDRTTRLEIVIDELVLVGFDPSDRHRIADALEQRLAEQLSGIPADQLHGRRHTVAGATLCAPDAVVPAHTAGSRAHAIADGISRSVFTAITGVGQDARPQRGVNVSSSDARGR